MTLAHTSKAQSVPGGQGEARGSVSVHTVAEEEAETIFLQGLASSGQLFQQASNPPKIPEPSTSWKPTVQNMSQWGMGVLETQMIRSANSPTDFGMEPSHQAFRQCLDLDTADLCKVHC